MQRTMAKDDRRRVMLLAAYQYRARHQEMDHAADAWQDATDDLELTLYKHGNDPFLLDLLVACYADMEREVVP